MVGMSIDISVIIPVYNAQDYLKKCLDSIINQTLKDIEIICVDDGSTDNSLEILKEYKLKDERIKIYTQRNSNAGIARNKGIKYATGEYIHFIDADDYLYDENVYKCAMEIIKENKFPKVLRGCAKAFDNETNKIVPNNCYEQRNLSPESKNKYLDVYKKTDEAIKLSVTPWIGFVRRDFLLENNIRFNSLKCCNDHSFFIACIVLSKNIYVSSLNIVMHRVNNKSSLIGKRNKYFDCQYKSFYITKKFLKKHKVKMEVRRKILTRELYIPIWFYSKCQKSDLYKEKIYLSLIRFLKKIKIKNYEPYISSYSSYSLLTSIKQNNYWKTALKYYFKKLKYIVSNKKGFQL